MGGERVALARGSVGLRRGLSHPSLSTERQCVGRCQRQRPCMAIPIASRGVRRPGKDGVACASVEVKSASATQLRAQLCTLASVDPHPS